MKKTRTGRRATVQPQKLSASSVFTDKEAKVNVVASSSFEEAYAANYSSQARLNEEWEAADAI